MTIRKRIFISNTVIVLVALLLLFGIFGGVFEIFQKELLDGMEKQGGLAEHTYEMQTLFLEEQSGTTSWEKLALKAQEYGFDLYVEDENGREQFSNLARYEQKYIEHLKEHNPTSQAVNLYYREGITAVTAAFQQRGGLFHVYAVCSDAELPMWGMSGGMFETFLVVFVITGLLAILGLLLLSQIFTRMLIKTIMKPVEVLELAAQRINDGDLNTPIVYTRQDEFQTVCNTFNRMQEHLREGMERNAAYEKARTSMISGISHDLRTPLTSVKAFIKGILDGVANTPDKQRKYLQVAYQKSCEMEVLLQKLFFFSKMETGNMPLYPKTVDLGGWMESYAAEKQEEGEAKGYSLELYKEDQVCPVEADMEQMRRVFDNLIENSVKYAEVSDLHILIQLKKEQSRVHILFQDNGKGLEAEKLPHVFEQFYRGDEARDTKKEGSGLGLYVCQYIVKAHHGEIRAFSDNGFGVEIELPAAE